RRRSTSVLSRIGLTSSHRRRSSTGRSPDVRRSPLARSRGGNRVSPTSPLPKEEPGEPPGSPVHNAPSTHSSLGDGPMSYELICIGASWGGLRAIETVLSDIPAEVDPPIVIAQHRDAQKSALADVISRHTSRPVVDASDKQTLDR